MLASIDWLSFTVPIEPSDDGIRLKARVRDAVLALSPALEAHLGFERDWYVGTARAPFRSVWQRVDNSVTIFASVNLPYALIEMSGQACQELQRDGLMDDTLAIVHDRLTRIDIACDIECDILPVEFAEKRDTEKFKSYGHVVSASGETYYVGSRTSDRYARVYRYNEPHERARFLRVEHVVKAKQAKLAGWMYVDRGLPALVAALGETFKWRHDLWQPTETGEKLKAWRPERHQGKTMFWLNSQVAPALIKLARAGDINIDAWIDEFIRPYID